MPHGPGGGLGRRPYWHPYKRPDEPSPGRMRERIAPGQRHQAAPDGLGRLGDREPHDLRRHVRDPAAGHRPSDIRPAHRVAPGSTESALHSGLATLPAKRPGVREVRVFTGTGARRPTDPAVDDHPRRQARTALLHREPRRSLLGWSAPSADRCARAFAGVARLPPGSSTERRRDSPRPAVPPWSTGSRRSACGLGRQARQASPQPTVQRSHAQVEPHTQSSRSDAASNACNRSTLYGCASGVPDAAKAECLDVAWPSEWNRSGCATNARGSGSARRSDRCPTATWRRCSTRSGTRRTGRA